MSNVSDLITKLQADLYKLVPSTASHQATISVVANILGFVGDELEGSLSAKIDTALLLEGLNNIEAGIAQTVQGGEQINTALKGPAKTEEASA